MKLFRLLRSNRGFTLIELLIVIALLGALAVGLIGALDPFEQLKKGTDTATRDLTNQIQTAAIRYYSIKNDMPWCPATGVCADLATTNLESAGGFDTALTNMITAGELKTDFRTIQDAKLDEVWVTGTVDPLFFVACYEPTSKSFQADPNTKFSQAGVEQPVDTCASNGGAATDLCYWCIQ